MAFKLQQRLNFKRYTFLGHPVGVKHLPAALRSGHPFVSITLNAMLTDICNNSCLGAKTKWLALLLEYDAQIKRHNREYIV